MKKLILALTLLVSIPVTAWSKDQVVVVKQDCFERGKRVYCKLTIKNIGETDVKNVWISMASPRLSITAENGVQYLSAKDKEEVILYWNTSLDLDMLAGYSMQQHFDREHDILDGARGSAKVNITYEPVKE